MSSPFAAYRSLFPHIAERLWLNHAAIGPMSTRTKAAVDAYILNRHTGTIDDFPQIVGISNDAKRQFGALINAPKERIAFANNTSDGLNLLANGLDWKSGDRILLNDMEFPANVVPFLHLQRLGVEIDFVRHRNGELLLDDITAAITPRTRLLSISAVQFLSGFRADLSAIGALCKQHNIIFCVDAIQAVGNAPLDVQSAQIDFLSCGTHKWLMSMMGLACVYITEEMQSRIVPQHVGWTSNRDHFSRFFEYRLDFDSSARRYENGAQNNAGIAALGASAALLNEAGIPAIHSHLLDLTDIVIAFADAHGIPLATPRERSKRSGIITMELPEAERIFAALNDRNITVSLRDGKLRISPHIYNSAEDIHTVCAAVKELLP